MATDNRARTFVCVDVEARGSSFIRNGMNALGLVVYSLRNGDVPRLLKRKYWALAPLSGQTFEHECVEHFWKSSSRTQELMREFDMTARPVADVMREFYELIAPYTGEFKVTIINDAPEFDIPFISYYLDVCGYPPLVMLPHEGFVPRTPATVTFAADEEIVAAQAKKPPLPYSSIPNVVSYANGLAGHSLLHGQLNKDSVVADLGLQLPNDLYDHRPDNDAEFVARMFFAACGRAPRNARAPKPKNE